MGKLVQKFERGVCLGVCPRTDEAIMCTPAGIVRAGTVKLHAIKDAWKASSLLSISTTPWTTGRHSKRHELTVENDEEEKLIKVDESELPEDPRRFRVTKEDIEDISFSDGCVGCNAMRQDKTAQRHSEYCRRRRAQEDKTYLKSTDEGRRWLEKAEEQFTEALVRASETMESLGMRAAMNLGENMGSFDYSVGRG